MQFYEDEIIFHNRLAVIYRAYPLVLSNYYQLLTKSYYVEESKLCKIDTFRLAGRAFEQSRSVGKHSESKLVFKSVNRYSFAISHEALLAATDKKKLESALMYHNQLFTIYSENLL